jgi:hypothetical protein
MEGWVVVGGNGMQGDAQQLGLDHSMLGEGGVEVRWMERIETIPEGDVRGRWLLGLERDQAMDRVDDVEWLTPQQELPSEGRSVELTIGQAHTRMVTRPSAGSAPRTTRTSNGLSQISDSVSSPDP